MAKKIQHPINKGIAKVPVIMQLEALECGAASLAMILAYYGKWLPLEQVRSDCGISRDGSNAKNILLAARYHGLKANGYRYEPESLRDHGTFPCIIHWNFNHFVVLNGFHGNKVYINDPGKGSHHVDWNTFDNAFTGICLQFEPSDQFEPGGKQEGILSFVSKRLKGTGAAILFTALTGIIAALMNVISPVFSRVFMDRLLTHQNPEWLIPFLAILAVFNLIQIVSTILQSIYSLRLEGKFAAVGNATYMWKILHLPMGFFSQRMSGDIQSRQATNGTISKTVINTLAPLAINAIMTVIYFVLMIRYSPLLTIIGLASIAINAITSKLISNKRGNLIRISMQDSAKLYSATTAGIELIEAIKASGAENGYFARWAGYQANVNANSVRSEKLNQYYGIVPTLVSMVSNNLVLLCGVWLTMQGHMTVGMVMAFQGFLSAFMSPAMTFVTTGQTLQEVRTQMERVDDVMEYPTDDMFLPENAETEHTEYSKLSGKLEIRNLSFGYSPLADPLIQDFNLTLEPGKSVAIVGSSGCGKSTMSKLISGIYRPWSGEILFDGKPISEIDKSIFFGSLAVVDQDIVLFDDTIANNIKMWDNSIEDFEMILAARDAQLHDDIMARPQGYQHKLLEGGRDFSGGQRQRIEIARVLAQDPTLIILDEATSALDAQTEYDVVKAISDRGIACIVIAHRLSTIRSCDEIIVMDHGHIVARGNHSELLEHSPLYSSLVHNE